MPTFADLSDNDTFTLEPEGSCRFYKKVCDSGTHISPLGSSWGRHSVPEDTTPVYNVETEAERDAKYAAQQEKERAERKARADAHRVMAGTVAKIIGWSLIPVDPENQERGSNADLKGPDGMEIVLNTDNYQTRNGKINIYGRSPKRGFRFTATEINVSKDKTPEQIARDITRRLLPDYTVQFNKALEELAKEDAHKNKIEENKKALQAAGVRFSNGNDSGHFTGGGVDVSSDSIRFNLYSVTPQQALKIVKLLKEA